WVVQVEDPDGTPHVVVALGPGQAHHRCRPDGPAAGRYEARYGSAAAVVRDGEFIPECRPDGAFAVAGLGGTVLVRSPVSGTVVLRRHDAVLVDASGSAGPVIPLSELALSLRRELAALAEEPGVSLDLGAGVVVSAGDGDGPADAVEPTTRAAVDPGS